MIYKRLSLIIAVTVLLGIPSSYGNPESGEEKIPLTVAAVCMHSKLDKEANLETFASYMKEASEKGAHLIVFPEYALQQNPCLGMNTYQPTEEELAYLRDTAETVPGNSTERLVEAAKQRSIYMVFGMVEKSQDGDLYNASVFLGPDGVIGRYRTGTLWDSTFPIKGNEHLFLQAGAGTAIFDSPLGRVGLMLHHELLFDPGPVLAEEGADLLVTVSYWEASLGTLFEQITVKNTREAHRWHVVSEQVGPIGHDLTSYGHSRIIDPDGNVVADTGAEEGMVIATTDILIDAATAIVPVTWGRLKSGN